MSNNNGVLSDDEINEILEAINNGGLKDGDDSEYIPITSPRRIHIADFMHLSTLSFIQIDKLKRIFRTILQYFERDFYKITGKQLLCELDTYETMPHSIYWFKKEMKVPNYIREIFIEKEQVLLQVDPIIVNKVLLDRENNNDITLISKRIANQYILDLLKGYLQKLSDSEVTEVDFPKTIYTTTEQFNQPDNIIENPRYIINTHSHNNATFRFSIKCTYKDITGNIRIEMSDQACLKLLGEKRTTFFACISDKHYYEDKNCFVSLGLCNITEERLQNIHEGDTFLLNQYLGDTLELIYQGKNIAKGEGILIDYNYGLRVTEVLYEKDQLYYPLSGYNAFLLLGSDFISNYQLGNIREGIIFELDTLIGDYFPLVYNNNIIAYGDIEDIDEIMTLRIKGVLNDPVPFIN